MYPSQSGGVLTSPPVTVIAPKKSISPKKILLFGSVFVLLLGIIAAVYLVGTRQLFRTTACDCNLYNFLVDTQGNVTVTNNQSIFEPAQLATVTIDGSPKATLDVPELSPGETVTIGSVSVPDSGVFTWSVTGSSFCSDSGSYVSQLPIPTVSPTPGETQNLKICHFTAPSAHPWQAIEIALVDWDIHIQHGDFVWQGNLEGVEWPESGHSGITPADIWCENHVPPEVLPTLTPIPLPSPTDTTPPEPTLTPTTEPEPSATPTSTFTPTLTPTLTPILTQTPVPTLTPTPTSSPISQLTSDTAPGIPNVCNGTCGSDSNCGYAEDGTKLICVNGFCRHPNCADQISCHCPPPWPTSTTSTTASSGTATTTSSGTATAGTGISGSSAGAADSQLPQSGVTTPTIILSFTGLLLLSLGLLLAL